MRTLQGAANVWADSCFRTRASLLYRVNAEWLPPGHLVYDEHESGGRILGGTRPYRPDRKTGGDQAEELINTTLATFRIRDSLRASPTVEVRVNRNSWANLQ